MTDKKKLYSEHITAAKDWLGKAEESIAKDNDIRSDLNIMLAQAELQRAKEKDDTALIRKRLKWILPWITAIGIAVGYVYFLRPELFTTVREESPAVTVVKEENVPAKENIIQTDTDAFNTPRQRRVAVLAPSRHRSQDRFAPRATLVAAGYGRRGGVR